MNHITVYLRDQKDRPFLKAEWILPGTTKTRSRSLKTRDPVEAERRRAELEYELNHGLYDEKKAMGWAAFRQRYDEQKLIDRRPATRKKAGYVFDRFEKVASPRNLGDIDEAMLASYAASLRKAGEEKATVAGHLAYLRAALRWAKRQKLIRQAPEVEMPKLAKKKRRRFRTIDKAGFEQFVPKLEPDWRLLAQVAWHTGMRRGELFLLGWQEHDEEPWLDLERNPSRIWFPAEAVKADSDQWLPVHPDLRALLLPLRQATGRLFTMHGNAQEVGRTFRALTRAAGLDLTLHDLRRSFGTRYAPLVPAQQLQRLMRHASISTTLDFYVDLDGGLDDAIAKG